MYNLLSHLLIYQYEVLTHVLTDLEVDDFQHDSLKLYFFKLVE